MSNNPIPSGVFTRDHRRGKTTLGCDVVIVGSGAGGATVAAEFAEAGLEVVLLEEGRYYGTRDFNTDTSASVRKLYRSGAATMAIGSPPIMYQEGRCVGGSTVINGGMAFRPSDSVLESWSNDHQIAWMGPKSMELYFKRVEHRQSVATNDLESIGRDNQLLKLGADKLNWKVITNLRNQVHCAGSNNCTFGCPTGAKQSALVSYIPRALHFGARVYSDVKVKKILKRGKRATGVIGHTVLPNDKRGAEFVVHAKLVVAACGAMYTPVLLSSSGLRPHSGMLGKNLFLHPNVKVEALMEQEVRGWEGVHQAYQVREFRDRGIMAFAAVNLPPSVLGIGLSSYGKKMGEMMDQYKHLLVAGMLLKDHTSGVVKRAPGGSPLPIYNLAERDACTAIEGVCLLSELLFEVGAQRILLPFAGCPDLTSMDDIRALAHKTIHKSQMEILSVHLMGTARMGGDRALAVTDHFGMVYDTERLMVADASLFPSTLGVNPMLSIQALATRNAHWVLENRKTYLS